MRLISLGATSSEPIVDRKRGASVSACASIVFFGIAGGSRRPFVGENAHAKKWKKQALEQHSFALQRSRGKVRRQLVFFSFSACFFFLRSSPFAELLTATTARGLARALAGVEVMTRVRVQVAVACIVPRACGFGGMEKTKKEGLKKQRESRKGKQKN